MNAQLRKEVASFNKKRKRLEAKGVTASLLPERASVRALKNAYRDTESLQARLRQMASFTSKGATRKNRKGVVGTDSMFDYRKLENQQGKKYLMQQLESSKGQKTRYKSRLKQYRSNIRRKIQYLSQDPEKMSATGLLYQRQNAPTTEGMYRKSVTYKKNYFEKLDVYASIANRDPREVTQLKRKLDQIPIEDFYRVIESNPELSEIHDFMIESPPRSGSIKSVSPRHDSSDYSTKFDDILKGIDNIIANSNLS